jgi:hypothetical protein
MSDKGYHDIRSLTGKEAGKTALVIGGGLSGANWQDYPADFQIIINGAVLKLPYAKYWTCTELDYADSWINTETPEHRILHQRWAKRMARMDNVYATRKSDQESDVRAVNEGLWRGPQSVAGGIGTSAIGALHLAGILGCTTVHSVGVDLCFKDNAEHHWYPSRRYIADLLAGCNQQVIEVAGLSTMPFWVESAKYLNWWRKAYAEPGGLDWQDHSDGLLQAIS